MCVFHFYLFTVQSFGMEGKNIKEDNREKEKKFGGGLLEWILELSIAMSSFKSVGLNNNLWEKNK